MTARPPSGPVLAVRLDSDGDVLLTGPAVRALAGTGDPVDLLVSPAGRSAAGLLPGVREVLVFDAPWTGFRPPPLSAPTMARLIAELAARRYRRAVVFTSFHQSPLPMALLARWAGVEWIAATSVDYPGSLVDLRHVRPPGHEVTAALDLAVAAGGVLPAGDDGRLRVHRPLPPADHLAPAGDAVVVHPAASVPARSLRPDHARRIAGGLVRRGWPVVVTGTAADRAAEPDIGAGVIDLRGRTTLPELAAVLAGARCVVAANTGPAHLAAAVGTPVVSLFAPVVPAERWAPYGVPSILLGDQEAPCRDTRARLCPVPGHPCLGGVTPDQVADAVAALAPAGPRAGTARGAAAVPA
ncbi:glycosyltransferase family 9 protein [Nakamurella sp.]|uniref:glycosyltransferase family 9 protein n=1 Tax=Nakamurella sp. TaxID=1869182 RepID=UPI003B3AE7FE